MTETDKLVVRTIKNTGRLAAQLGPVLSVSEGKDFFRAIASVYGANTLRARQFGEEFLEERTAHEERSLRIARAAALLP